VDRSIDFPPMRKASERVFPIRTEGAAVRGRNLFVTGRSIHSIEILGSVFQTEYVRDFPIPDTLGAVEFLENFATKARDSEFGSTPLLGLLLRTLLQSVDSRAELLQSLSIPGLLENMEFVETVEGLRIVESRPDCRAKLQRIFGQEPVSEEALCSCPGVTHEELVALTPPNWSIDATARGQASTALLNLSGRWRLFATTANYMGLAPRYAMAGDQVCILHQCAVPVLLRKVADHYVFVGRCFVPGLKLGEARSLFGEQSNLERFELY